MGRVCKMQNERERNKHPRITSEYVLQHYMFCCFYLNQCESKRKHCSLLSTRNNFVIKEKKMCAFSVLWANLHFFLLTLCLFSPSVASAPKVKPMDSQWLLEGKKLTLKCEAVGNPSPSFNWYKDGSQLRKRKDVKIKSNK